LTVGGAGHDQLSPVCGNDSRLERRQSRGVLRWQLNCQVGRCRKGDLAHAVEEE
jgi:hypothetical protein